MLIFLYGTDTYRLLQNRDVVISKYKAKHASGLNLHTIDCADRTAARQLDDTLKMQSFFSEVKLVVLESVFTNQQTASALYDIIQVQNLAQDPSRVVVAIHRGPENSAKPAEFFKLLSHEKNLVREFKPLVGTQFENWLKKEAIERGTPFASSVASYFARQLGSTDTWEAMMALEKVSAYSRNTPITRVAVDELMSATIQPEVFAFIDALGSGNRRRAVELLYRELSLGQDPYYLLTMVVYQFRTMLMIKDASTRDSNASAIASATGLKPFVIKKMLSVVNKVDLNDLRVMYQALGGLEMSAKQGTRDLHDSLYEFALSV